MSTAPRHRRVVVPVDLGGSPTACLLRPPPRPPPSPELIAALVDHYRRERSPWPGAPLEVAFFHGGRPTPAQLLAAAPHPLRLSCSPLDLERAEVAALVAAGLHTVEVELLSFHEEVLRGCRRGYGRARAEGLVRGLKELGLRVGVVLVPGLPGSRHDTGVQDARIAAGLLAPELRVDFVRILPALAFAGSELARHAALGRWQPMSLGQAVTTCAAMVDVLEAEGVPVARLGLQPGADLAVEVTAGPVHPNLRALVQARRFRGRLEHALRDARPGSRAVLRVHPKDLSWAKGTANENVRALRARLRLQGIELQADPALPRGTVARGSLG